MDKPLKMILLPAKSEDNTEGSTRESHLKNPLQSNHMQNQWVMLYLESKYCPQYLLP